MVKRLSQQKKGTQILELLGIPPQQHEEELHSDCPDSLLSHFFIIYEAQPTPGVSESAPGGQLRAQAPHSIHPSGSTISALSPRSSKTSCGQTSVHDPQPTHLFASSLKVLTFSKYLKFCIKISLK